MRLLVVGAAAIAVGMQQTPTFKSAIDVVTVPVSVLNGNRPVTDLTRSDFELVDNGTPQTVQVTALAATPIDVTLVVDTSDSVRGRSLDAIRRHLLDIGASLNPSDRVRVVTFDDNVSDGGFRPGGGPLDLPPTDGGGATSLYSALAAALVVDPRVARPQLVFTMTDGRDSASFLSASQVLEMAGRSAACLYVSLIPPSEDLVRTDPGAPASREQNTLLHPEQRGIYSGVAAVTRMMGPYVGGPNVPVLRGIAARTGGDFYSDKGTAALSDVFRRALDAFRSSYLLSYSPSNDTASGWHEITVRVSGHRYTIRARKGYQR